MHPIRFTLLSLLVLGAACGTDVHLGNDEDQLDPLRPAGKATVTVLVAPGKAAAGEEVLVTLAATLDKAMLADVVLFVTAPDGSEAYTASWPSQSFSANVKLTFTESLQVEAGDPLGAYAIGARLLRTGNPKPLFENAALATLTVQAATVPATPPAAVLPSGWSSQDIGSPSPAGSASASGGVFTVSGAGADIWGTSDSFRFVYRPLTGDGQVVARVTSLGNTHAWAKAGVMIRDGLLAPARHALMAVTPTSGTAFQNRPTAGNPSLHQAGPKAAAPYFVRLVRVGSTVTGAVSADGKNWTTVGSQSLSLPSTVQVGLAVTSHADGTSSTALFDQVEVTSTVPTAPGPVSGGARLLYSAADILEYQKRMSGAGPFYAVGDAGHGGQYSPGDGKRSEQLAADFLANPSASYWSQANLPLSSGDPWPGESGQAIRFARPMHAAWIWMTQPNHPQRQGLLVAVKALLLAHAADPTLDYGNSTNYPVNYPGFVPSPLFGTAQWMTRLIKARDMLGREAFSTAQNAELDRWFYDFANFIAKWMHHETYGKHLPGRLTRDYSVVKYSLAWTTRKSFDGGPLIGSAGMAYTNRHAACASTMSLAANYLKLHGYQAPTSGGPAYGRFTVDQLLEHSRLFVEETIRFSLWPQGVQGDFERGDSAFHGSASAQQGWLYSANVLMNLVEMAEYHAKRGDLSVWNFKTTAGFDGTAGAPIAGGFSGRSVHFYAWSFVRYVNDGWGRRNRGEPLVKPHFFHDAIPAAIIQRFAPTDLLLQAAWKRQGQNMPAYPQHPQSQGVWNAHLGEGAKFIGLIEHAGMPPFAH